MDRTAASPSGRALLPNGPRATRRVAPHDPGDRLERLARPGGGGRQRSGRRLGVGGGGGSGGGGSGYDSRWSGRWSGSWGARRNADSRGSAPADVLLLGRLAKKPGVSHLGRGHHRQGKFVSGGLRFGSAARDEGLKRPLHHTSTAPHHTPATMAPPAAMAPPIRRRQERNPTSSHTHHPFQGGGRGLPLRKEVRGGRHHARRVVRPRVGRRWLPRWGFGGGRREEGRQRWFERKEALAFSLTLTAALALAFAALGIATPAVALAITSEIATTKRAAPVTRPWAPATPGRCLRA